LEARASSRRLPSISAFRSPILARTSKDKGAPLHSPVTWALLRTWAAPTHCSRPLPHRPLLRLRCRMLASARPRLMLQRRSSAPPPRLGQALQLTNKHPHPVPPAISASSTTTTPARPTSSYRPCPAPPRGRAPASKISSRDSSRPSSKKQSAICRLMTTTCREWMQIVCLWSSGIRSSGPAVGPTARDASFAPCVAPKTASATSFFSHVLHYFAPISVADIIESLKTSTVLLDHGVFTLLNRHLFEKSSESFECAYEAWRRPPSRARLRC
jgi:hypothetical protein